MEAQRFFEWAKNEGLTFQVLADELGYHISSIFRIKSGDIPVNYSFKARVALAFGKDKLELFDQPKDS